LVSGGNSFLPGLLLRAGKGEAHAPESSVTPQLDPLKGAQWVPGLVELGSVWFDWDDSALMEPTQVCTLHLMVDRALTSCLFLHFQLLL